MGVAEFSNQTTSNRPFVPAKVNGVIFDFVSDSTLAPCSSNILTNFKCPLAQAIKSGVWPVPSLASKSASLEQNMRAASTVRSTQWAQTFYSRCFCLPKTALISAPRSIKVVKEEGCWIGQQCAMVDGHRCFLFPYPLLDLSDRSKFPRILSLYRSSTGGLVFFIVRLLTTTLR